MRFAVHFCVSLSNEYSCVSERFLNEDFSRPCCEFVPGFLRH